MAIEISVGFIAAAFVVLVVFLIIGVMSSRKSLREMNKLMHATKKDLDEISVESLKLIKNLNETTIDIKKKLHVADFLFKPFSETRDDIEANSKKIKHHDIASDIMECLAAGMVIYNKIKGGIKEYVKR